MKKPRAGRTKSPATTDYAESIIKTVREPLVVLDSDLRVTNVNRSFCTTFGVTSPGTVGNFIYDLGNREWDIPELRTLLEDVLVQSHTIEDFSVEHDFERLGRRTMLLNARRMHNPKWKTKRILLAIEDVTERKQVEKRLQESEKWFSRFMQHLPGLAWIKDADGRYVYANNAAENAFRVSRSRRYMAGPIARSSLRRRPLSSQRMTVRRSTGRASKRSRRWRTRTGLSITPSSTNSSFPAPTTRPSWLAASPSTSPN